MQMLLDSATIDEALKAAEWGWVSGTTTNPTLLAKSNLSPEKTLKRQMMFNDLSESALKEFNQSGIGLISH